MVVGCVFCRTRLDGIVCSKVRRDGANSTVRIVEMIEGSQFVEHVQAILLLGIALAGFNVVDIRGLNERTGLPVLVVVRKKPNLSRIRGTLLSKVPGGARKWRLIERAGPVEPLRSVFVQRAGLSMEQARSLFAATTLHGNVPEPLRSAHLIAGGVTDGASRGRA